VTRRVDRPDAQPADLELLVGAQDARGQGDVLALVGMDEHRNARIALDDRVERDDVIAVVVREQHVRRCQPVLRDPLEQRLERAARIDEEGVADPGAPRRDSVGGKPGRSSRARRSCAPPCEVASAAMPSRAHPHLLPDRRHRPLGRLLRGARLRGAPRMPIRDEAINVFMGLPGRRRPARADLQLRRRLVRARHGLQPHRADRRDLDGTLARLARRASTREAAVPVREGGRGSASCATRRLSGRAHREVRLVG
jgi:hypothetical protein